MKKLTVRIEDREHARLQAVAEAKGRSVQAYIAEVVAAQVAADLQDPVVKDEIAEQLAARRAILDD